MTAINVIQSLVSIYAYVLYVNMMHITSIWNTYWRWRWWCFSLCALNELQWRLIDMPSLKNFIFMHMQIFFELLAFLLLLLAHFSVFNCFDVWKIYAFLCTKHICCCCFHYFKYLTDWMTDWLTEYILWLSKYSTNESSTAQYYFFVHIELLKRKKIYEMCVEVDIRKRSEKNDMRKVYVIPS